jgi:hypothetical protein
MVVSDARKIEQAEKAKLPPRVERLLHLILEMHRVRQLEHVCSAT